MGKKKKGEETIWFSCRRVKCGAGGREREGGGRGEGSRRGWGSHGEEMDGGEGSDGVLILGPDIKCIHPSTQKFHF